MLKFILLLPLLPLIGCAAALVPESSNPRTKINQATTLFNEQQRPVGAVKLLKQAIPLAQQQNDKESEADAEFYLGEIYKSPGKNGEVLKNPNESIEHLTRAITLYTELKFYKKAAFVSWNRTSPYETLDDKKGLCRSLKEAEALHEKPEASPRDILPPPFSDGVLLNSTKYLLKEKKC